MILSRIGSKARTTIPKAASPRRHPQGGIPKAVGAALGLRQGDGIADEIDGDRAVPTRADAPDPFVGTFSTFTEWAAGADCRAYDGF